MIVQCARMRVVSGWGWLGDKLAIIITAPYIRLKVSKNASKERPNSVSPLLYS